MCICSVVVKVMRNIMTAAAEETAAARKRCGGSGGGGDDDPASSSSSSSSFNPTRSTSHREDDNSTPREMMMGVSGRPHRMVASPKAPPVEVPCTPPQRPLWQQSPQVVRSRTGEELE